MDILPLIYKLLRKLSRLLPGVVHFLVIQHITQPRKCITTLKYHLYYYKYTNKRPDKLHIGSGNTQISDYINLDADWYCYCDIVSKIYKLKFSSDTVSCIYSSHVLEHVPKSMVMMVLKEWRRVLKPGGMILLSVPDIEVLFSMYLQNVRLYQNEHNRKLVNAACDIIYGGQVTKYDYHYYGYSFNSLQALMKLAGFIEVSRVLSDDLRLPKVNDARLMQLDETYISLNIMAVK